MSIYEGFDPSQVPEPFGDRQDPKHTDTSRSGDLVKRLRKARVWPDYSQSRVTIETAHEAADCIEALIAEKEAARKGERKAILSFIEETVDWDGVDYEKLTNWIKERDI